MQKHTKNYIQTWNIGEQDNHLCEMNGCSRSCADVHHIEYRSQGGTDDFDNLIGLCRIHHNEAHAGKISKEYLLKMKKYPILNLFTGKKST